MNAGVPASRRPDQPACLELRDVTVLYGHRPALDHVTLAVPHGGQVVNA